LWVFITNDDDTYPLWVFTTNDDDRYKIRQYIT
jgi:hypothetical protein